MTGRDFSIFCILATVFSIPGPAALAQGSACLDGRGAAGVAACTDALAETDMLTPAEAAAFRRARAEQLMELGDHASALADLETLAETDAASVRHHYRRALALSQLRREDEARGALEKALALDPHHVDSLILQARLALAAGDTDAALESAGLAATLAPESPEANRIMADVLAAVGAEEAGERSAEAAEAAQSQIETSGQTDPGAGDPAAPSGVSTGEVTFWDAVRDSDDPGMLQAYLDAYPEGVYRPLAQQRLAVLRAASALPAPTGPEPAQPSTDTAQAPQTPEGGATPSDALAVEMAFWASVKDSDSPEIVQTYLDAYPDGVFAPIAAVRIRLLRDAATRAEAQSAARSGEKPEKPDRPRTAEEHVRAADQLMKEAEAADRKSGRVLVRKAQRHYLKAAEQGHAGAAFALGDIAREGLAGRRDRAEAIRHYVQAGDNGKTQGYVRALGMLERSGQSTPAADVFLKLYLKRPTAALQRLTSLSSQTVVAIQFQLRTAGYYRGALDGEFGPQSRRAIRQYRRDARQN